MTMEAFEFPETPKRKEPCADPKCKREDIHPAHPKKVTKPKAKKPTIGDMHKADVWDAVERYAEAKSQMDYFNNNGSGRAAYNACEKELTEARNELRYLLGLP